MRIPDLSPYVPGSDGPWDARTAAHLLYRAGFGASPSEIERAVSAGLEPTVDSFFSESPGEEEHFQRTFEDISASMANFGEPFVLRAWWIHRMVRTSVPLREKLALFWHGHFATSIGKVENTYLMHRQIETIRQLAWGNFRELVLAIARDPAMLVYLDGESNTKEHPNENFARELMELFTCGIGNYSEKDVAEAARAFTGWHREGSEFRFNPEAHDDDVKRILGRSGRFDGSDVVDILMQHAATPRFMARKLLRFFATAEPADSAVDSAAESLDRAQLHIKWFLRDLFLSKYFFSDECRGKRIASPVEFVVGAVRTLGVRIPAFELAERVAAMGQELLAPPNVKGWDGEQKWINSSTWPARVAFAEQIAGLFSDNPFGPHLDLPTLVPPDVTDPNAIVDRLAGLLMAAPLAADTRRDLSEFLITTDEGKRPDLFRDDPDFRADRTRAVLGMLLGLPEFHNC